MIMMMLAAIVLLAPTTVAGAAAAGDQTSDALQRPPSQSQSQSDPPSHPHGGRSRAIQYLSAESFEGLKQVAPFIVAVLTVSPASTLAAQSQLDARYQSTLRRAMA
ncbi:hypothetical protein CAOG_010201 [Capsaspora owczarzaki ATCC 30864]|uniref:Uncharacterized protein n=1 Tax=Capsaspora owczarzaki (strain ATCC 30864) TaxID=595528 RepID=A0A0D2UTI2_CAPO3|nr:hypothetical protein CAOG_010201 [Capsaspora owczarzaki ATCC 30864]